MQSPSVTKRKGNFRSVRLEVTVGNFLENCSYSFLLKVDFQDVRDSSKKAKVQACLFRREALKNDNFTSLSTEQIIFSFDLRSTTTIEKRTTTRKTAGKQEKNNSAKTAKKHVTLLPNCERITTIDSRSRIK
uniref:Uncharacterized protein n=1 Tax=Romanomermis culicivorax TaxID=13658 RepID=A0A915JYE9_ROMCU